MTSIVNLPRRIIAPEITGDAKVRDHRSSAPAPVSSLPPAAPIGTAPPPSTAPAPSPGKGQSADPSTDPTAVIGWTGARIPPPDGFTWVDVTPDTPGHFERARAGAPIVGVPTTTPGGSIEKPVVRDRSKDGAPGKAPGVLLMSNADNWQATLRSHLASLGATPDEIAWVADQQNRALGTIGGPEAGKHPNPVDSHVVAIGSVNGGAYSWALDQAWSDAVIARQEDPLHFYAREWMDQVIDKRAADKRAADKAAADKAAADKAAADKAGKKPMSTIPVAPPPASSNGALIAALAIGAVAAFM